MRPLRGELILLAVAAVAVCALGFFAGRSLRPGAEPGYVFTTDTAPYVDGVSPARSSRGGFSGFGEVPGLEGRTVVAGSVESVSPAGIVLKTAGGVTTLRTNGLAPAIYRLEAADRQAIRPGSNVVVRQEPGSDEGVAVLLVSEP